MRKYRYHELSQDSKHRAFVSVQRKLKNSLGSGYPVKREMVEEKLDSFTYLENGEIYERGY